MPRVSLVPHTLSAQQPSQAEVAAPQSAQDPLVALGNVVGNDVMAAALAGDFMTDRDAPLGATVASGLARLAGLPQCDPYSSNQAMMRWMRHAQSEPGPLDLGLATRLMSVSAGASLPEAIVQRLSTVLGHDLHHVRVHVDGSAARAAEAVSARAFTVGNEIYFNAGEFQPGTPAGDSLLLHELTHVVQHDEGRTAGDRGVSSPNDPAELEAERVSRALLPDLQALEPMQSMDGGAASWDVDAWMNEPAGPEGDSINRQASPEKKEEKEKGWLDTLRDIASDTVKGDFSEDPHLVAIFLRTLIGLIPGIDQALDAQDICAALYKLLWEGRVDEAGVWIVLALTLIGCIPGVGSIIKGVGKAGLKLLGEAIEKGARAIPVEKLLELVETGAKKLDLDSQLEALLAKLDELTLELDTKKLLLQLETHLTETLQMIIARGEKAKSYLGRISKRGNAAVDKILLNAHSTLKAGPKRLEEAVDQTRRAIGELKRFVRETLGQASAKRSLGAAEFARIEADLGPELTRTLCGALDGKALQSFHKKVGAGELRRLGEGVEPSLLSNLCTKLDADGVAKLGPDRMIRLFGDMGPPLDEAVTRLSKTQLDALSELDPKVLDSLAGNTPARKVELLNEIDELVSASKWDTNYLKFPINRNHNRSGHGISKHGPQRTPDEMKQEAIDKANRNPNKPAPEEDNVVSQWNSAADFNKIVAAEERKLFDVANQVHNNPHCILNKDGFSRMASLTSPPHSLSPQNAFDQILAERAKRPSLFRKKIMIKGSSPSNKPLGTSYYPKNDINGVNGYTVRSELVNGYTVHFELAADGKYHLDTAYPTKS